MEGCGRFIARFAISVPSLAQAAKREQVLKSAGFAHKDFRHK
jgi:hypothetical protein